MRKDILQKRLRLPFEEVFEISSIVQKRFLGLKAVESAKRLALYASCKNEVITDAIFEYALAHGKEVFFPRVVRGKRGLTFLRVHGKKDFIQSSYEIHEPAHDRGLAMAEMSSFDGIIIVPGVAFDRNGNRLGYGKGYYDKALGSVNKGCLVAALAFDFQIVERIPAEEHDIKMHKIITESRVINTERGD